MEKVDVRCWLITGPGGARMDFIAGWLGLLPGFLDGSWMIDPMTGLSVGESHHTKEIDIAGGRTLREIMLAAKLNLTADSDIIYPGSCHGWNMKQRVPEEDSSAVKIIYIDTPHWNHHKICWEFVIKTHFTSHSTKAAYMYGYDNMNVKMRSMSSDEERVQFIHNYLSRFPSGHAFPPPPPSDAIMLDYDSLFTPGNGGQYLTYRLGLTGIPQRLYDYYDAMLRWTESPEEIERFGKIWRKKDYFPG